MSLPPTTECGMTTGSPLDRCRTAHFDVSRVVEGLPVQVNSTNGDGADGQVAPPTRVTPETLLSEYCHQDTEDTLPLPGHIIDVPWDSETEESGDVHRSLLPPQGGLDDVHASWAAAESDDDLSEVPSGDMKSMGPMDSVLRFDSGRECGTPESFYQDSDHYTQPDD